MSLVLLGTLCGAAAPVPVDIPVSRIADRAGAAGRGEAEDWDRSTMRYRVRTASNTTSRKMSGAWMRQQLDTQVVRVAVLRLLLAAADLVVRQQRGRQRL